LPPRRERESAGPAVRLTLETELAPTAVKVDIRRLAERGHSPGAGVEVALGVDTGRDTELNRHRRTHTALIAQHDEAVNIGVAPGPAPPLRLAPRDRKS